MVHTGKTIRNYIKKCGITVDELATIINRSRSATYKILAASSISTSLLYDISLKLGHNFFSDLGKLLIEIKENTD